jgi:hypothetical protein
MADVVIDVSKLPTIPDSCVNNCRYYWSFYRNWIIFGIIILALSTAVVLIIVFKSPTMTYPCLPYQSNTLASSVSIECLQYVWSSNCQVPYTFPSDYTGWWRSSPQGTKMVSCRGTLVCGVGSYNNIIIYLPLCHIGLNQ